MDLTTDKLILRGRRLLLERSSTKNIGLGFYGEKSPKIRKRSNVGS